MKYPQLVRKEHCKTPVKLLLYQEGISEDGEPLEALTIEAKCNYQDKAFTKMTADKHIVTLSGKAYFIGDIAPSLPAITGGEIEVYGVKRQIYSGTKGRNPDSSVNFTMLEVV